MDCGHWKLINKNIEFSESTFGFIYLIVNNVNNKKYIGKKQCVKKLKRKPLKGKKNKRIEIIGSDWKTYTSSSNELNNDILILGKEKFSFYIIRVCNSKWELAYYEIKEQISQNVLLRDDFYNGIINVRIGRPPKNIKNIEKNNCSCNIIE